MNKKYSLTKQTLIITGVVGMVSLGSLLPSNTAYAEDKQSSDSNETTSTVSMNELDNSLSVVNSTADLVSQQQEVVDSNQSDITETTKQLETSKSELEQASNLVSEATEENISTTKDVIQTTITEISEIEQKISDKLNEISSAESEVSQQQKVVESVETAIEEQETEVEINQLAVTISENILNDTAIDTLLKEQETAQKNYEQALVNQAEAEKKLASAIEYDSQLSVTISETTEEVSATQTLVNKLKNELAIANDNVNTTSSALALALKEKENLENTLSSSNTVNISKEYVTALKGYYSTFTKSGFDKATGTDSSAEERAEARTKYLATLKSINATEKANNSYVSNNADKSVVLTDLNNLSESVRTDLSLFASNLINQIRNSFGSQITSVTTSSVEGADLVTDGYVTDNWAFGKGHDNSALDKASEEIGIISIGENLNSWNKAYTTLSLDSLKKLVYEAIIAYMFNGQEWLHALGISGLDNSSEYIGVDLSVRDNVTSVHVTDFEKENISSSSFSFESIANTYDTDELVLSLKTATETYNSTKIANELANTNLTSVSSSYQTALSNLQNLEDKLNELQSTASQTDSAKEELNTANTALTTAKTALDLANQAVASIDEDKEVKVRALNIAKQNLALAESKLLELQSELLTEKEKLTTLKSVVDTKNNELSELNGMLLALKTSLTDKQSYLNNLESAEIILSQSKSKVTELEVKLSKLLDTDEIEKSKLSVLKQQLEQAESEYNLLYSLYQTYLDTSLKNNATTSVEDTSKEVNYDYLKSTVSFSSSKNSSSNSKSTGNSSSIIETETMLPKTGSETTLLSSMFGLLSLLSAVGLSKVKKYR